MNDLLVWSLRHAREQTLELGEDIPAGSWCLQSTPTEHHPAWVFGHLLLGDVYLLRLLGASALPSDFDTLLHTYGPGASVTGIPERYLSKDIVTARLRQSGALRVECVRTVSFSELGRTTPDEALASSQPTLAHHINALVFHEGYHAGQLSTWRLRQGLAPVRWILAPRVSDSP
jgi:hypothetical protein